MDRSLQEKSVHVHYEAWMLHGTVKTLLELPEDGTPQNRLLRNALIESFCMHLRVLMDFLYSRKKEKQEKQKQKQKKDDVMAENFVAGWSCDPPPLLAQVRERCNKEIAHLTTVRYTDPKDKQWEYEELYAAILSDLQTFQAEARDNLDACWEHCPIEELPPRSENSSDPSTEATLPAVCYNEAFTEANIAKGFHSDCTSWTAI